MRLCLFGRKYSLQCWTYSPCQQNAHAKRYEKPWVHRYLLCLRRRDSLFCRSKRLSKAYHQVRNLYVAELRFAEKKSYSRQCSELSSQQTLRDPHCWWSTAKSLCGMKSTKHIPTLVVNGSPVSSPPEKAECPNTFLLISAQLRRRHPTAPDRKFMRQTFVQPFPSECSTPLMS